MYKLTGFFFLSAVVLGTLTFAAPTLAAYNGILFLFFLISLVFATVSLVVDLLECNKINSNYQYFEVDKLPKE